jgi:hypothetical protein
MAFTLTAGNTKLVLDDTTDYYPYTLVYNNKNYIDNLASVNGCVIWISGNGVNTFIGGQHGFSRVIGSSVLVDGERFEPATNGSYTGENILYGRTVDYASGIRLDHTIHLRHGKYDDNYTIYSTNSGVYLDVVYSCLGSRSNRLNEYFFYANNDVLIASGLVTADDESFTTTYNNVRRTRMRSLASGDYCDTIWRYDERIADWRVFINDRAADNKLYCSAHGFEGFAQSKQFAWSQSIRFSP